MDNMVTAKFYQVVPDGPECPDLVEFLTNIVAEAHADRERDISAGRTSPVIVRLERFEARAHGFYTGELIRKQTVNIPPEANDDGLEPVELSEGGGLAYSSAFSLHRPTSTIVIQANRIAVSKSRFKRYLEDYDGNAKYAFEPLVQPQAWDRFNAGAPRKLAFKIANLQHVPANFNNEPQTVGNAAANIAEALGSAYITIEVSMGSNKGSLAQDGVRRVLRMFQRAKQQDLMDVRSLTAAVKPEGEETDVIDFLDEMLVFRDVFDLPSDDIEQNYMIRANALHGAHRGNIAYIRQTYGGE